MSRSGPLILSVLLIAGLPGCSGKSSECAPRVISSDQTCAATADCVEAGFQTLTCVDGLCQRQCARDADCALGVIEGEAEACKDLAAPPGICEAQLCVVGCPDVPCGAGESCVQGRCVYDYEGFEIPAGGDYVDLPILGFNQLPKERENVLLQVAWQGRPGCSLGDERCAGPAAAGERFGIVGTYPTPPRGAPLEGKTCRTCACCLECLLDPPPEAPILASCPRQQSLPLAFACPAAVPPVCRSVCEACESCPGATRAEPPERLLACEALAASKTCTACTACPEDEACEACDACAQARRCVVTMPGSAACMQSQAACAAQGADGCFLTPIRYRREQLTEAEQALVSRPINLAGAQGRVVLQLDYVPFNVGFEYRPGIQGTPPSEWPTRPQELRIQLCGGRCEEESSWRDAAADGAPLVLPPQALRRNGLTLGSQTALDWRGGRVVVPIPEDLRTAELRYRLLPRLGPGVLVGVDEIYVRRLP